MHFFRWIKKGKSMKYTYPSGSYYEGEIVENKFEGKGIYAFANGDIYEGEFANDMLEGYGKYKYKTGSLYDGMFSKDMFHGLGTLSYRTESIEKGKFHQDKRVGKFFLYDFQTKNFFEIIYQNDIAVSEKIVNEDEIPLEKKPSFDACEKIVMEDDVTTETSSLNTSM